MFDPFNYSIINGVCLISEDEFKNALLDITEDLDPDLRAIALGELQHFIRQLKEEGKLKVS